MLMNAGRSGSLKAMNLRSRFFCTRRLSAYRGGATLLNSISHQTAARTGSKLSIFVLSTNRRASSCAPAPTRGWSR